MKKIALILTQSAFSHAVSREAQDLALALAAVEHQITVIYLDAAVTQLLPADTSHDLGVKNFPAAQKLFAMYDIAQVVVASDAMALYGLTEADLRITADWYSTAQIVALLAEQNHIIRC